MTATVARAAALAGMSAVLAAAPVGGQTPFRQRTDLVSVYATVTDQNARLVTDLTQNDFEVKDDGKTQPIALFSNDVQPITIVVMLDRSGSMAENSVLVQEAADQFVHKLLPNDSARIGDFSREIEIQPAAFTSRQDELEDILAHRLQPEGPSPVWTAVDRSITALLHESGRRVVLIFTDGHDSPIRGQVVTDVKDVMRRAMIDEVMVYAIGLADTQTTSFWTPRTRNRFRQLGSRPGSRTVKPDPGLRKIAEQTGGGYFELSWNQDLGATFSRVADELHHQYLLAFTPRKLDGEMHKLEVKLKRRGLTVRARKSYVAGTE